MPLTILVEVDTDLKQYLPPLPRDVDTDDRPPSLRDPQETNLVSKEGEPTPNSGESPKVEKRRVAVCFSFCGSFLNPQNICMWVSKGVK